MVQIRIRRINGIYALLGIILFFGIIFLIIRYLWKIILYIVIFFMVIGIIRNITSKMNESMFSKNKNKNSRERSKNKNRTHEKERNKEIIDLENYKIE